MNLLGDATSLIIGIDAVLTFYTALLHLTRGNISSSIKFRIVRDLIVGTLTLQLFFISKQMQFDHPFLIYPFVTLLFISGSFNVIRYFIFLYPGGNISLRLKTQLIPAAILLAGETWFHLFNANESQAVIRRLFDDPTSHLVTLVIAAAGLFQLGQYMLLLRLELGFIRDSKTREPILISSILTLFYILATILIAAGFILANQAIMNSGILLMGLTGITYLLFENRYPYFYQLVAKEERQKKYKKSLIQGLSKEKIMARLLELMQEEKIYRQLELKLDEVAAMLLITPHQLSEFLNDQMGMNFSSYINHYRVEEAKDLLVNHPEQSTLSIGFEVGFGSKPSFNTTFKLQTGMTPSEFRKNGSVL